MEGYESLLALAAGRDSNLRESYKMWLFYWESADEQQWIKEKEQLMSSPDLGHDLATVLMLISKHRVCTSTCILALPHTNIHALPHIQPHIATHTLTHNHTYTHIQSHINMYIYTYTHIHSHIHTHTFTRPHSHMQNLYNIL